MTNDEATEVVVKPTTLFPKVIKVLTQRYGLDQGTLRLFYDGRPCGPEMTPKMLEMKKGRTYEMWATVQQEGGGIAPEETVTQGQTLEERVSSKLVIV
jgi:hypothetical protein